LLDFFASYLVYLGTTMTPISSIRSREKALDLLLPKLLGLLWEHGLAKDRSAKSVVGEGIELSAQQIRQNAFMLSVGANEKICCR
jgi:hypothetical protein